MPLYSAINSLTARSFEEQQLAQVFTQNTERTRRQRKATRNFNPMQGRRLTVTPVQSMINGKSEVPHDNQGLGLSPFPLAIGSEDQSPEKPGLDEKILPTTESQTPIGPSLSQALTLAS